ncbi:lysozyme inhibitor LprI family protein [Psychrobacter sp. B38]|uniref:lysozyme inhibitor LprI family protein n=1 Tax=Psychrobacter sp. B38 TaxID=3143538 RepID=UPI00320D6140
MRLIKTNIKKVSGIALLSVSLFMTAEASAASVCDNAYTQADMNKCTATELSAEDSKLNRSYSDLQRLLSSSEKKQLKAAQLAWIDFRDKACQFSARSFKGGSAHSMALNGCLTTYTHQRRVQLDDDIDNINNR